MGIVMRLATLAVSFYLGTPTFKDDERLRTEYPKRSYPSGAEVSKALRQSCTVTESVQVGQKVYTLRPKQNGSDWHIVYIHGGGYVNPIRDVHWGMIAKIIDMTGASVTVPLYRLAPEANHHVGTALIDSVLDDVHKENAEGRIAVAGDSAGGHFALNIVNYRHRLGKPLPDQIICFAPCVDLSMASAQNNPEADRIEAFDIMLGRTAIKTAMKWWCAEKDPASPEMSPLYADIAHLPPTAIFQGDRDILVLDCRTYGKRLQEAGKGEYHEYPGGFHVFMALTFLPESQAVFCRVAELLPRQSR